MIILILVIISLANFFLQSNVLPYISISGVVPNTALILIICISIYKGKYYGGFFGIFIGLMQDILFSSVIGINALIYFIFGYFIGNIEHKIIKRNIIIPILLSVVGVIYYNFSYYIFMYFLSRNITLQVFSQQIIVIEIIYTAIISVPILIAFKYNFKKLELSFGNNRGERFEKKQ